ncbi:unnamed protein product [Dimorphilus gyrociliatus]|uniref:Uncharacterized protein n=1 Tax=Dimorphilus gyrociliatus TaxID=2664684 RepID=A0A7I8WBF3_9ANNE|nr:unnamed protein product [Dimorphilus gyrociliatus]
MAEGKVDKLIRCDWSLGCEEEIVYHDKEWGVPVHDDRIHFEFLTLEGAQAGLNWRTILKKREAYREAFDNFDVEKIAEYKEEKIENLMKNPGIVKHRLKINSTVKNAKLFLDIQKEFGTFDSYVWKFVDNKRIVNKWEKTGDVPATSKESDQLSADLKKRGFKYCGSTIMYAYMQACGLINDHLVTCFRYGQV